VAKNLITLVQNPQTSAREVGELISKDQALTSRVLRLVNSAYYGFPKQITTVNHAVVILGFNRVKNIVLAASIFRMKDPGAHGRFDAPAFWRHSLGAAVAARALARELGWGDAEEGFVCGLLHDIGKLVLAQSVPAEYEKCLEEAEGRHCTIRETELEILGLDHATVGAWLAERWALPPAVHAGILNHHGPGETRKDRDAVRATHLGDIFARAMQIGSGGDSSIPHVDPVLAAELDLSEPTLDRLSGAVIADLHKARDFFGMIEG
jgi:putative nucleotidyltransferase with HDIG domain